MILHEDTNGKEVILNSILAVSNVEVFDHIQSVHSVLNARGLTHLILAMPGVRPIHYPKNTDCNIWGFMPNKE